MLNKPILLRKFRITHESRGHALLFWHQGFILAKVSINPDTEAEHTDGIVKAELRDLGSTTALSLPNSLTAAQAMALMAGRVATEIFCPKMPTGTGHRYDFENLQKLAKPDPVTLKMLRWRNRHPDATMEDFYQVFKPAVARILKTKQAKRAGDALAKALDQAGCISGQEAAHILSVAWGDPPPPLALPVERHMALTDRGPQCYGDLIRGIRSYLMLIEHDIKHVRDTGTDEENEQIDKIWKRIILLKVLI